MGTNLDVSVKPESRVEVTLSRRWQPPELIISGSPYPWGSGTYALGNDVEKYHTIHVTGQKGTAFISKTISPLGMMRDTAPGTAKTWAMAVEKSIDLKFTGAGHKTLIVTARDGYALLSIYGER